MSQDNPNDPVTPTAQSAEPSANARGAEPITEATLVSDDGAANVDEPATDDAEDDMLDAESEASEDGRGEASPSEPASSANEVATSPQADAPSAKSEAGTDDRSEIEKQPYAFDHCTVQIALQLLPDDGDAKGRRVIVGVRSHLDAPILRVTRLNELGALPPFVTTLLDELKADLPKREQAAREALEKKKAERAERRATVAAARTSRGKKSKATAMATAPAPSNPSANAPTDNRPRPEVNVPTNPQQQMGLF